MKKFMNKFMRRKETVSEKKTNRQGEMAVKQTTNRRKERRRQEVIDRIMNS